MKHILEQAQQGKLEARAGQTIYLAFEISVNEVLNDVTEKVHHHTTHIGEAKGGEWLMVVWIVGSWMNGWMPTVLTPDSLPPLDFHGLRWARWRASRSTTRTTSWP